MKNLCVLIGHLGGNPSRKTFPDGGMVAEFSLATSDRYKDRSGEVQKITDWHKVKVWGKLAQVVVDYCKKGQLVMISGKIKTQKYDNNGTTKYITYIKADELKMLGGKRNEESRLPNYQDNAPAVTPLPNTDDIDEIPF